MADSYRGIHDFAAGDPDNGPEGPARNARLHVLGCDEYHQHLAPRCCASDCWCQPVARPGCLDCGLRYEDFGLDVILPRPQWLTIHPNEHGLLCARCIVARAAKVPGATCCHLIIEVAPHGA